MKANAVVDDLAPEVAGQLVLDETAFSSLGTFAQAGVVTLREMKIDELPENLRTYEAISAMGTHLGILSQAIAFWTGDLLIWCEDNMPEQYAQIAHDSGLSERTLLHRVYVCRNVPPKMRVDALSWSHHAAVSSLGPKEQKSWLRLAATKGLSSDELRERMKAKRKDDKPELPLDTEGGLNTERVVEVAKAILRDARPAEDDRHHLIPNDDVAQLRAALGEEE